MSPTNIWGMLGITAFVSIVYAPTIPLTWAIFADVADYSEWKTGRRFTGMVFATIGFAFKSGLALGSASFLLIMVGFSITTPSCPTRCERRARLSRFAAASWSACFLASVPSCWSSYQLNKRQTIQMADELAERRKKFAAENPATA